LFDGERGKNLGFLLVDVVIFDENATAGKRTGGTHGVTGEDRASFFEASAEDLIIVGAGIIEHVEAEKAQPFRQSAQHGIRDELHEDIVSQEKKR
jgi:hypothetical protein